MSLTLADGTLDQLDGDGRLRRQASGEGLRAGVELGFWVHGGDQPDVQGLVRVNELPSP